jgi:AcrR family transcriptional regulator
MISDLKKKCGWKRRKEMRPSQLLEAAFSLFVEHGYAATRMEDVAAKAGVSKGTLYLYFNNKENLFSEVVRGNMLFSVNEIEALINNYQGSSAELFTEAMLIWWDCINNTKHAGLAKLTITESLNFPNIAILYHEEVIAREKKIIISLLKRGIMHGDFRQIDVDMTMNIVVAPMAMLLMERCCWNTGVLAELPAKEYLNNFIQIFLHGLLIAPSSVP